MRLINAVRELRYETRTPTCARSPCTRAAERAAMFVREADEAVCIDDGRPADAGSPYLDLDALERALVAARADAAWVGWGFVAERPEFAELCDRLGVVVHRPERRRDAARSATRSAPSCWPSRPTSRWRRGAAARSTRSTRPAGTPPPSATR